MPKRFFSFNHRLTRLSHGIRILSRNINKMEQSCEEFQKFLLRACKEVVKTCKCTFARPLESEMHQWCRCSKTMLLSEDKLYTALYSEN